MKLFRKKIVLVLIGTLVLTTSCSTNEIKDGPNADKNKPSSSEITEEQTTTVETTVAEITLAETTVAETTVEETTKAEEQKVGTRKNPANPGDIVAVVGEKYDGTKVEYNISITDVVRGEEANKKALEMNQFNKLLDGEETVLFTSTFELVTYAPKDDSSYFVDNIFSFSTFKSDYSEFNTDSYVTIDEEFSGEVYEGGKLSGLVGKIAPVGEDIFIVFEDLVWFKIPA